MSESDHAPRLHDALLDEVRVEVPEKSSALLLLAAPEHVDAMLAALRRTAAAGSSGITCRPRPRSRSRRPSPVVLGCLDVDHATAVSQPRAAVASMGRVPPLAS